MPSDGMRDKLSNMRLSQTGRLLKRLFGLQYLRPDDFMPHISPQQADRITELSRQARGDAPPAILVLGVMPRSGTNFVRDLLALHPDIHADPESVYEFPLLHAAEGARAFMTEFFSYFPRNSETLSEWDGLALLAGAWLGHWQSMAGDRHILLKCPHVQNLGLAPYVFPDAKIFLCVRDGRDVIDSTMRTFPRFSLKRKTFSQLASEWRLGTEAICTFAEDGPNTNPNIMLVRYEDVVAEPEKSVSSFLAHAGLDPETYPIDRVTMMPVRGSSRSTAANDERWQPEAKTADFNPVQRWANWSNAKKTRFARLAGPTLKVAGYDE